MLIPRWRVCLALPLMFGGVATGSSIYVWSWILLVSRHVVVNGVHVKAGFNRYSIILKISLEVRTV